MDALLFISITWEKKCVSWQKALKTKQKHNCRYFSNYLTSLSDLGFLTTLNKYSYRLGHPVRHADRSPGRHVPRLQTGQPAHPGPAGLLQAVQGEVRGRRGVQEESVRVRGEAAGRRRRREEGVEADLRGVRQAVQAGVRPTQHIQGAHRERSVIVEGL